MLWNQCEEVDHDLLCYYILLLTLLIDALEAVQGAASYDYYTPITTYYLLLTLTTDPT